MPNNALRLGCGNKLVYISQAGPRNLQDGRKVPAGLGVRDECCNCKCECSAECLSSSFADNFSDQLGESAPAQPPYYGVTGTWEYTGTHIKFVPEGTGEFWLKDIVDEPQDEFTLSAKGYIDEPSTGAVGGGIVFKFDYGGDSISGRFTAEKQAVATQGEYILEIDALNGGEIAISKPWGGYPEFSLNIRFTRIEGGDDIQFCAYADGLYFSDGVVSTTAGEEAEGFTNREGGITGGSNAAGTDTVYFNEFTFCPYGACPPESYWWSYYFDRYDKFDHVIVSTIGFPWNLPISTIEHTSDLDGKLGVIRYRIDASISDSTGETIQSTCSKLKVKYNTSPGGTQYFGITHGQSVSCQINYSTTLGWTISGGNGTIGGTSTSLPFTPTGESELEFHSWSFGANCFISIFVDGEPVLENFDTLAAAGHGDAGFYGYEWEEHEIKFLHFKTTITPPEHYPEEIQWDGTCSNLSFNDQFDGAGFLAPTEVIPPEEWSILNGQAVWNAGSGNIGTTSGTLRLDGTVPADVTTYLAMGYSYTGEFPNTQDTQNSVKFTVETDDAYDFLMQGRRLNPNLEFYWTGSNGVIQGFSVPLPVEPSGFVSPHSREFGLEFRAYLADVVMFVLFVEGESYYISNQYTKSGGPGFGNPVSRQADLEGLGANFLEAYFDYWCTNILDSGSNFAMSSDGPGTAARKVFESFGCDGRSYIHTMNNNGTEWCLQNIDLIADWVVRSARLKGKDANKNQVKKDLNDLLKG